MAADFKAVAEAALQMANVLLPEWLGGTRRGHEWVGERKANGGPGDSWSVNLNTGKWGAFGSGLAGGDLVSLYAALNHVDQVVALKEVAILTGVEAESRGVRTLPRAKPAETPSEPIPEDAPPIPQHFKYGTPSAVYRYGSAFLVCRYDFPDGSKQFTPLTWRGKWQFKAYPAPRPLYGVDELAQRPTAPVLVVEGEKCADAARGVLRAYVVVTWAGGSSSVKSNDWQPLADRDVLIWPDADEPGARAAAHLAEILSNIAARVRIVQPPSDTPAGWDVADAVATPWDAKQVAAWATPHVKTVFPPADAPAEPESEPKPEPEPIAAPVVVSTVPIVDAPKDTSGSALIHWDQFKLDCNEGGQPFATVANASTILQAHPDLKGRIWLDTFRQKIFHSLDGTPREWRERDDLKLTVRIQQALKLPKFDIRLVQSAVLHAAECQARNSVTEYLDSLTWDGMERLDHWLADCLGVKRDEYTTAVARNWLIAMVARAYVPGCKVDTMPVLEGTQGLSKSTFLEVLGSPWYGSIPTTFGEKDFLQAIQGRWLVEIPDMTGFSRSEHSKVLATLTIRHDIYRPTYGRYTFDHPRAAIFAATSETDNYLNDIRGRRRYWPLRCTAIDIDALQSQRDQLFAEAVKQYRAGEKWYEVPNQADEEQRARVEPDLWTDRVMDYADALWAEEIRSGRTMPVTSARILADAIELPLYKQTDSEKKRINRIMRENGWIQVRDPTRRWKKISR